MAACCDCTLQSENSRKKARYSCHVPHILGAALVGALFSLTDPCSDLLEMQTPEIISDWRVFSCCLLQNTRNGTYIVIYVYRSYTCVTCTWHHPYASLNQMYPISAVFHTRSLEVWETLSSFIGQLSSMEFLGLAIMIYELLFVSVWWKWHWLFEKFEIHKRLYNPLHTSGTRAKNLQDCEWNPFHSGTWAVNAHSAWADVDVENL